jgi:hypothetical protein
LTTVLLLWQEQIMDTELTQHQLDALRSYSAGEVSAIELRRRLGGATYGDVLRLLGAERLPFPEPLSTGASSDWK